MTLVVARIVEDNIHIHCDTKVTCPKGGKIDHLRGAFLKTIIINPYVSLSFAGDTHFASEALSIFFNQGIEDLNVLLNMLLETNKKSNHRTDFGVASIIGRQPKLFKISNGAIDSEINNFWLGDIKGFSIYQDEFHKIVDTTPIKNKMRIAFQKVIQKNIPNIGNFHISLSLDYEINPPDLVFLYDLITEISITRPQTINLKTGKWVPIPLGTVESGDYGSSYLITVSPLYHGVAIHFPHARKGILFCPYLKFQIQEQTENPCELITGLIITNIGGEDFIKKVKQDYNVPLMGLIVESDTKIKFIDGRNIF